MLMKRLILTFCMVVLAATVFAQGPGLPGEDPDTPVPIDGGLLALLAAGIGYGLKKMKDRGHSDGAGKKQGTP
jgi:hypothetical protein